MLGGADRAMKILYLCRSLEMGGVERNLVLLSEGLIDRGHQVIVCAGDGVLRETLEATGARFFETEFSLRDPRRLLRAAFRLRTVIAAEQPDVIHVFSAASGAAMALAAMLRPRGKRPVRVASVMGLQESAEEPHWITDSRNYLTVLGAQRTFVISPMIERHLARLPLRKDTLVSVPVVGIRIPAWPDAAARASARTDLSLPPEHSVVTTIGRLAPRKSHELFVRAAELVRSKRPNTRFLIVGEGELRGQLEREIADRGLAGCVRLLGERSDLDRVLSATDVCVKPGVVEGFVGISVLNAQALGVPVVAFDTVDVRMAVEPGVTGMLADSGRVDQLAEAILALLDDPVRALEMARCARQSVEERFGIESVVGGLVSAYEKLACCP